METGLEVNEVMEGGATKRKLVIKPFKVQPKVPDNFETKTWKMLEVL